MVSLLKGWYGDAATKENEFAFDHLPKPAADSSWLSIFDQALRGRMEGLLLSGMTATSIGPDSNQVLEALGKLKWLCVMDAYATTSSEFWHAPGIDPSTVQTEVLMLPATHWIEKDGSFTNSGRWAQWKEQVLPPEGEARHDHWILAEVFQRVRDLYTQQGGKYPAPMLELSFPYRDPRKPELDEIAQEINGRNLTTGKRLEGFGELKDDGTTTAGDWIYTGHYPEAGNLTKRRNGVQDPTNNDPTGMGFYPEVGVELAGQPARALQPRLGRPAGATLGSDAGGHPVGCRGRQVDRRRTRLPGRRRPDQAQRAAAVHHDRRRHGAAVQQRRGGRTVPRALRARRVADREPTASHCVGDAGGLPLRQRWRAGPTGSGPRRSFPTSRRRIDSPSTSTTSPSRSSIWSGCSRRPSSRSRPNWRRRRVSRPATTYGCRRGAARWRSGRS